MKIIASILFTEHHGPRYNCLREGAIGKPGDEQSKQIDITGKSTLGCTHPHNPKRLYLLKGYCRSNSTMFLV